MQPSHRVCVAPCGVCWRDPTRIVHLHTFPPPLRFSSFLSRWSGTPDAPSYFMEADCQPSTKSKLSFFSCQGRPRPILATVTRRRRTDDFEPASWDFWSGVLVRPVSCFMHLGSWQRIAVAATRISCRWRRTLPRKAHTVLPAMRNFCCCCWCCCCCCRCVEGFVNSTRQDSFLDTLQGWE